MSPSPITYELLSLSSSFVAGEEEAANGQDTTATMDDANEQDAEPAADHDNTVEVGTSSGINLKPSGKQPMQNLAKEGMQKI